MWQKLRSVGVTCLIFGAAFAGVLVLQLARAPRWDEPRNARASEAEARTFSDATRARELLQTTVADAAQIGSSPRSADLGAGDSEPPAEEAASSSAPDVPAIVVPNDPTTRIQQLSYAALTGSSRLQRLVAINSLGSMIDQGEEIGQIKVSLNYAIGSPDPLVAEQARALYNAIDTAN